MIYRIKGTGFAIYLSARQGVGAIDDMFVLCAVNNLQEIIVLLGWYILRQAKLFTTSVIWQQAMRDMGVIGIRDVRFLMGV